MAPLADTRADRRARFQHQRRLAARQNLRRRGQPHRPRPDDRDREAAVARRRDQGLIRPLPGPRRRLAAALVAAASGAGTHLRDRGGRVATLAAAAAVAILLSIRAHYLRHGLHSCPLWAV